MMLNQGFSPILDGKLYLQDVSVTDSADDFAATSAAVTAGAADPAVIDLGTANQAQVPQVLLCIVIPVTALDVADNDESVRFRVIGSNDDFTTKVLLGTLELGALETLGGSGVVTIDKSTGVHRLYCTNMGQETAGGEYVPMRKITLHNDVTGSLAGVTWTAWATTVDSPMRT